MPPAQQSTVPQAGCRQADRRSINPAASARHITPRNPAVQATSLLRIPLIVPAAHRPVNALNGNSRTLSRNWWTRQLADSDTQRHCVSRINGQILAQAICQALFNLGVDKVNGLILSGLLRGRSPLRSPSWATFSLPTTRFTSGDPGGGLSSRQPAEVRLAEVKLSLQCSLTSRFEERETQAAESWRIRWASQALDGSNRLWRSLRFSHHHGAFRPGRPGQDAFCVKVPVTQRFLG